MTPRAAIDLAEKILKAVRSATDTATATATATASASAMKESSAITYRIFRTFGTDGFFID
jgi:hypothetical protein